MDGELLSTWGGSCRIYRNAPSWQGRRTAAVGAFQCEHASQGRHLLSSVAAQCRAEGFGALIGPMNGDTWHNYRLVTGSDGSPPFAMEPFSRTQDRKAFESAGYAPISTYVSSRTSLVTAIQSGPSAVRDDVAVMAWDGSDADVLLDEVFAFSATRFSGNPFFKPIEKSAFLAQYRPVLPSIDPRLVLLARNRTGLLGFLIGIPNWLEGRRPWSVILKTYAGAQPGIGHLLAGIFHRTARDLGFSMVIYALMHVDNASLQRVTRYGGRVFRRYALMGKTLR